MRKTIELMCINYGSSEDALTVMHHCLKTFPRFQKATLLHPEARFNSVMPGEFPIEVIKAKSPTQNECVLLEQPHYVTCDHVLNIQWDGFIVNPDAWTDEFLDYDLVAAPWPLTNLPNPAWRVGSTGIGLYSKKLMKIWTEICAPHPAYNDWEMGAIKRDLFEKRGIKYAPLELARRFAEEIPLEDQSKLDYTPFGFHGFRYGDHDKYRKMIYG
jgi:hypothetical protein